MEARMKNLTGCISRRTKLVRVAGSTALAAALLGILPLVSPAAAADYYGYGEPRYAAPAYPPAVQYEERYEYRAPAYPRHGYEQPPVEYRVLVYPPRPRYYDQGYEYAVPPYAAYENGRRPVRVVRPERYDVYPGDPYRPQYVEEPLLPPAYVGPPRW
jgi:hypothetical protein